jgi:hypothetical protein
MLHLTCRDLAHCFGCLARLQSEALSFRDHADAAYGAEQLFLEIYTFLNEVRCVVLLPACTRVPRGQFANQMVGLY